MNKFEKKIYDLVKNNPKVKNKIRDIYQGFYDLLPDRDNYFAYKTIVKEGYFFGFHDISPFSDDEKYVLSNKLELSEEPLRMPSEHDLLTVGYWNTDLHKYTSVKKTITWNYHKGCRLQWVGDSNDKFIFNDLIDGEIGSIIYSISTGKTESINYPIDTISPNGLYATSFSYERLNRYMPGYGYNYRDEAYFEESVSDRTGLFLIDLSNNTKKLIVSLKQLASIKQDDTMKNAHHYVTHTEFSPDGKKIAFFHRWTYEDPDKRYTRLFTCNLDGTDLQLSNTSGMVSHYVWDKKHGLLAFCQINGIDGHYIFDDYTLKNSKRVAARLNSDGHQSYVPYSDYFVVDTYPDKRRYTKMYMANTNKDEIKLLADIKSPKKFHNRNAYENICCDLHPRVSPSGRYISFDSVHTGKRAFCVMKIR